MAPGARAAEVVRQVAGARGLWPGEREDIAEELIAHFLDGLDDGHSEAELVRDFGDPQLASRLVRIAKRRGRPALWHAARWAAAASLLPLLTAGALYGLSAARLYLAEPVAARATIVDPPELRSAAWELYGRAARHARRQLFEHGERIGEPWSGELPASRPLEDATRALVLEATRESHLELGWSPRDAIDVAGRADYVRRQWGAAQPELDTLIALARALCLDARHVARRGDAARAREDVAAALAMADQARGLRLPVADRAAAVIEHDVSLTLLDVDLLRIARGRGWESVRRRLLQRARLDGVRRAVADLVRFMYSEDGWTGGRLTDDGIELVRVLQQWHEPDVFERLARPAWYFNPAAGQAVIDRVDELLRLAERSNGDPREREALDEAVKALHGSRWQCFRYPALSVVTPEIARILRVELAAREVRAEAARRLLDRPDLG